MTPHPGDVAGKNEKQAKSCLRYHYWEFFKTKHFLGPDGKPKGFFRRDIKHVCAGQMLESEFAYKLAAEIPLERCEGQYVTIVEHLPSGFHSFAILHPKDHKNLYGGRGFVTEERKFRREGKRIALERLKKAHPELVI